MDNLLHKILNKLNTGIILIDSKQNIIIWNNWMERFTGKSEPAVIGKSLGQICPRFSEKLYQNIINSAILKGQGRFCSGTLHKNFIEPISGAENNCIIRQNLLVEPMEFSGEGLVLLQIVDVSSYHSRMLELKTFIKSMEHEYEDVKESDRKNRELALHDSLTGLPNRLLLMERLVWSINFAKRNNDNIAVMFIDMDGFKEVNDVYGHEIGDKLLVAASKRLGKSIRKTDTLARLAGDEFIIVLTQIKDIKNIELIASKIIRAFEEAFTIDSYIIRVGLSIGISLYPNDGEEPEKLIRNADFAMYDVKRAGKMNYSFFRTSGQVNCPVIMNNRDR